MPPYVDSEIPTQVLMMHGRQARYPLIHLSDISKNSFCVSVSPVHMALHIAGAEAQNLTDAEKWPITCYNSPKVCESPCFPGPYPTHWCYILHCCFYGTLIIQVACTHCTALIALLSSTLTSLLDPYFSLLLYVNIDLFVLSIHQVFPEICQPFVNF